jgi:hypothetical protein
MTNFSVDINDKLVGNAGLSRPNCKKLSSLAATSPDPRLPQPEREILATTMLMTSSVLDDIWYHGYHISWTQQMEIGGFAMSSPTRPEDTSKEAHNRGGLEDRDRLESYI